MIFKETWQQVLSGTKTQTRRIVKPNESALGLGVRINVVGIMTEFQEEVLEGISCKVRDLRRIKWRVGNTYAVQPGRGKKAVGRIRITKIRRERLQEISWEDMRAEGIAKDILDVSSSWRQRFADLWNSLYRKAPHRWQDNPECWVIEFERVIGKEKGEMEKLVETNLRILESFKRTYRHYLERPDEHGEHEMTLAYAREIAEEGTPIVLSAVRDGRLNIPGDIGELSVGALRDITEDDLQFDLELWAWVRTMVKNGADIFIALRKEGTGKEEEVNEMEMKPGIRIEVSAKALDFEDGKNHQGKKGTVVREERGAWWVLLDGEVQERWFGPSELEIVEGEGQREGG